MIGIFDSGYGGLPTMRALVKAMPEFDYVYLGDHARAPYGSRTSEEIYQFALQGVEHLFAQGCELVVFACNTAASNALRRIQQEILPTKYPTKRVLGVLVPTVEQITVGRMGSGRESGISLNKIPDSRPDPIRVIGILATEATVRSAAYTREIQKRRPDIVVIEQACPDLVPLIERGAPTKLIKETAKTYVDQMLAKYHQLPNYSITNFSVLLGCTHYELIAPMIAELLTAGVKLYQQSGIVVGSLKRYLELHPTLQSNSKSRIGVGWRAFLTTGDAEAVSKLGSTFFGSPVAFQHIYFA